MAYCYPLARPHAALAKKMGFTPAQVQDNLLEKVGDACAAWPLMMLVGALEEAKPGTGYWWPATDRAWTRCCSR